MRRTTLSGFIFSASCAVLLAATGCGGDSGVCDATSVMGTSTKYGTNDLRLPAAAGSKTFVYDYVGDGKPKNALKTLIVAISQAGLMLQDTVTKAVAAGDAIILGDVQTSDPMNSTCAGVSLTLAKAPAMPPKFDGNDKLAKGDFPLINLYGKIENGKLTTTPSVEQTPANEQKIDINLPLGPGMMLPLSLRGVHLEGTVAMDGGKAVVKDGQIHGVLSQKDIDDKIVPLVANLITKMINDKPMDSSTKTIIGLFENMGPADSPSKAKCMANAKDCCATNAMTCKILPAEVKASVIGGVLSSDVEVFDGADKWAPNKENKNKNGMSVGLGFSMVKADW